MILSLKQKTFFDLFPVPEFLLLSTTGITITDTDIKLVRLQRKILGGGIKLTHFSRTDSSELVSALKGFVSRYGSYIRATLPEENSYLFTASIDRVSVEGLYDAVAFIVEENVPISLAESVFDFEIIDEDANSSEIKLAVTVLPKKIVDAHVKLFESAGMVPVSFDTESQAVARAIVRRGDKRPQLIINLSLGKTGLYVVEDEVVQFSITLTYDFGEDDSYPHLEDLKSEMNKVFSFWNDRTDKSGSPSKQIEQVLVTGLGASRKDFVEKLISDNKTPLTIADTWVNMSFPKNFVPDIKSDEALDYASAIGLILPHRK